MSATSSIIQTAKETLQNEAHALLEQIDLLSDGFEQAVKAILATSGKVVVSGMGKSGIIGKKIAATLASTGTPSFFLHPAEAFHGDLGMVAPQDLVLLLSNSGETDEVLKILPFFKENGNVILAMSARTESTLALNAHHHIWVKIHEEACPLKLAPTTSTTVMLAMGDAMAVALMREKGFMEENYARFHPGGSLGRKLLAKVEHKMRTENLPLIQPESTLIEVIQVISEGRLGLALVNEGRHTLGIITDGDLRRLLEREGPAAWNLHARQFMTPNPKTVTPTLSLHEAEEALRQKKITSLIVVDAGGDTLGIIQIYDLH
ncbi:MAG: KpsF/GutQ family sugar-phosphate isomerase [Nitritalea sp.]